MQSTVKPYMWSILLVLMMSDQAAAQETPKPTESAPATKTDTQTPTKTVESKDERYDRLIQESLAFYRLKRYDDAIKLLDEAYLIKKTPNIFYNKARIYEEQGNFSKALETYRAFVKSPGVKLSNRKLAVERIKALEEIVSVVDKKPAETTPKTVVIKQEQPKTQPTQPKQQSSGVSGTGTILFTLGVVTLAAGGIAGAYGLTQQNDLAEASTLDSRRELASSVETTAIVADSLFIAGGALAVTGIVLWLVSDSDEKPATATKLAPVVGPQQAGVVLHTTF